MRGPHLDSNNLLSMTDSLGRMMCDVSLYKALQWTKPFHTINPLDPHSRSMKAMEYCPHFTKEQSDVQQMWRGRSCGTEMAQQRLV